MYRAHINALTSRTAMREGYEKKVYFYLVGYSLVVALILVLCGFQVMTLPENVLVALAGSTAVAALGLVAQIGKGLFGSDDVEKPAS
jgi:Tfp pilus assembly protein PilN